MEDLCGSRGCAAYLRSSPSTVQLGTDAFNMSLFFDKSGSDHGFRAFCSMISRINPNPSSTGDSAFMERLHLEPVIMTLPEDIGNILQKREKIKNLLELCNQVRFLATSVAVFLAGLAAECSRLPSRPRGPHHRATAADSHHLVSACNDRDVFLPIPWS